jgi:hypothetical protein
VRKAPSDRVAGSESLDMRVRDQCAGVDLEGDCKPSDRPDGGVAAASLAAADVGAVEAGDMCQLLLREAAFEADLAQSPGEGGDWICRGTLHRLKWIVPVDDESTDYESHRTFCDRLEGTGHGDQAL